MRFLVELSAWHLRHSRVTFRSYTSWDDPDRPILTWRSPQSPTVFIHAKRAACGYRRTAGGPTNSRARPAVHTTRQLTPTIFLEVRTGGSWSVEELRRAPSH